MPIAYAMGFFRAGLEGRVFGGENGLILPGPGNAAFGAGWFSDFLCLSFGRRI
jgi:hypothetical protein